MKYSIVTRAESSMKETCKVTHIEGPGLRNGALIGCEILLPDISSVRQAFASMLEEAFNAGRAAKAREIREALEG